MEALISFADSHLGWIHAIEQMANRRLTDKEVFALKDLTVANDFDGKLDSLSGLTSDINEATSNFVEGICNEGD